MVDFLDELDIIEEEPVPQQEASDDDVMSGLQVIEQEPITPEGITDKIFNIASKGALAAGNFILNEGIPIAGGVAGGIFGGPIGAVAGAAAGRGVQETVENILTEQSKSIPRIMSDMVVEGAMTYVGGKVITKATPFIQKTAKPLVKALDDFAKNASQKTFNNVPTKLGNFISNVFRVIPENQKAVFVDDLASKYKLDFGVPTTMTRRMFDRGVTKVLQPKNFSTFAKGSARDQISKQTIDSVSGISDDVLRGVRDGYEKALGGLLNSNSKIDSLGLSDDIISIIADSNIGSLVTNKKGAKIVANNKIFEKSVKILNSIYDEAVKVQSTGSALDAHRYKQLINVALENKAIRDNSLARSSLIKIKDNLVNRFPEVYRSTNKSFSDSMKLADELVGLKDANAVEKFLSAYFDENNTSLREGVEEFSKRMSGASKSILDNALDEKTAVEFSKRWFMEAGGEGLGARQASISFSLPALGKKKIHKEIPKTFAKGLRKEEFNNIIRDSIFRGEEVGLGSFGYNIINSLYED